MTDSPPPTDRSRGDPPRSPPGRLTAEAALVARCAAGEREAWALFVEQYGRLLATLARRMLKRRAAVVSDADVDEVVAEVFLALVRRERVLLKRYDASFRLSTYLGVITRSEVGRFLKRRQRARAEPLERDDIAVERAPGPPEALVEAERVQALTALRGALETLAPRERLLLTLRYLDGLDYRAIGAALDLNPESVGQLLHRAKERLAARLPGLRALAEE